MPHGTVRQARGLRSLAIELSVSRPLAIELSGSQSLAIELSMRRLLAVEPSGRSGIGEMVGTTGLNEGFLAHKGAGCLVIPCNMHQ